MNAISLYVSASRLVFQTNIDDKSSWADLNRLVPYLRQSLSCTVCDKLLIEPLTPTETTCQHHVCRTCKGGKKKLKPSCSWCKDYGTYVENVQLRILLQCYKKLCGYILRSAVYQSLAARNASKPIRFPVSRPGHGGETHSCTLMDLIQEGAGFKDEYKSSASFSQPGYSNILPCLYELTSTGTQTQAIPPPEEAEVPQQSDDIKIEEVNTNTVNVEAENVTTIKVRKPQTVQPAAGQASGNFKKPPQLKPKTGSNRLGALHKPKGCRCGKATPTPGQLTCCGQRCPCYVAGKACIDCVCRGCRNPHRPGGYKVRPLIPKQHPIPTTTTHVAATREVPDNTSLRVSSYFLMDTPPVNVATAAEVGSDDSFQVIDSETLRSYHFPYESSWHHYEPH